MTELYEMMQKQARARWQKEERAGNLGDAERARIGYTQPEQGNASSARGRVAAGRELHNLQEQVFDKDPIRAARSGMQSYAPEIGHETTTSRVLQPGDAVARHQRLNALQLDQFAKHGPMVNKNLGPMGPANLAGMIFMGDDGANFIHEHLNTPSHLRDPASNASVMKSIMDHERAEGVQLWSQATGKLPSTSQASHAGLLPILAERMSTRDPKAQGLFEFMRRRGGEDKQVNDMLRNSGAVGNWVPPMGGRVHRTIEQKIRDTINPKAAPMAMQRRMFTSGTPDARTYLSELSSLPQEGLWQRLSRKTRGVVNPRRLWGTAALAATIAPIALMSYSRHVAKQKAMAMGSGASALPGQEEQKVANALLGAAYAGMTPASTVMNEAYRRRAVEEGLADPDNPHAKTNLYGTLGASALGLGAGYALTGVRKGNIIPAVMSSMASTLTNAYLGGKMDGHDMGWRNARFRGDVRRAVETPEAHVQAPTSSTMSAMYASEAPWMRDVTTRIAKREKPLALDHYVLKRDLDPETYAKVREVFK